MIGLLDNALKFSGAGEVVCRIGASEGAALVHMSDTRPGIPAQELPRLFTRFGRSPTAESGHLSGLGLGLYLARELARLHGGTSP